MADNEGKQISNPFSTGGGGHNFEVGVQACFAAFMLAGGYAPCLPCGPICRLELQARNRGYQTDDLVVVTEGPDGHDGPRLLVQIKHGAALTRSSAPFAEAIKAAWGDFQNPQVFRHEMDAIALVTGPLSATDTEDGRTLLEWARSAQAADEFVRNVETTRFSSENKRQKLAAFRHHVEFAAGDNVDDEELFQFLRHFHLLGYDLDIRSGVMHALLHTVIGRHDPERPADTLARICQEVASANLNAGTLKEDSFPDEIRRVFRRAAPRSKPPSLADAAAPDRARVWEDPRFGPSLAVACLVGSWDESCDADMRAITRLLDGVDRGAWLATMREIVRLADPPVGQLGGVWRVRDRQELWRGVGSSIFDSHLRAIAELAPAVLGTPDPDASPDAGGGPTAASSGAPGACSSQLREGLAETLALLGAQPDPLCQCRAGAPGETAAAAVHAILASDDWRRWDRTSDFLPLLAEAAPREFIRAAERAMLADPCPFDALFAHDRNFSRSRCTMAGVLFALETLAWEKEHLASATMLLGALDVRDPGGRWANRPAGSLREIFLPWLTQTRAPIEMKENAVRALLEEHPPAGWRLLLSLLPRGSDMSATTRRPRWRNPVSEEGLPPPSHDEYVRQVVTYADMAAECAENNADRLCELAEHLGTLPRAARSRVLASVRSLATASLTDEQRLGLWSTLSRVARWHRLHAQPQRALPDDQLSAIESVAQSIAPERPEVRHRALFIKVDRDLYDGIGDHRSQVERLDERRKDAVRQIHAAKGTAGVLDLASHVDTPARVGAALGLLEGVDATGDVLPHLLCDASDAAGAFAEGYARACFHREKAAWIDTLGAESWTERERARLLLCLPFSADVWRRAGALLGDSAGLYWRQTRVNACEAGDDLEEAVSKLIDYDRPRTALACLATAVDLHYEIDHEQAARALLDAATSDEPPSRDDIHCTTTVISALQDDPQMADDRLCAIEWAWLAVLDGFHGARARTIERRMASDPRFFCEVIRSVYRPRDEPHAEPDESEAQRALARSAYGLLRVWATPPGTLPDGGFDGGRLTAWLEDVRRSAGESGHLEPALVCAGQVLTHCPPDPGGLWLHEAAARALDAQDAERMRNGFTIALFNARGVHYVDPTGAPEDELADGYASKADALRAAGYHRLAAAVGDLADSYRTQAARRREGGCE